MDMSSLTSHVLVILAEVLIITVLFILLSSMLRRILNVVFAAPWLNPHEALAERIHRNLRIVLLVLGFLLCLGIAGGNAYLLDQGRYPLEFLKAQARKVTLEDWLLLSQAALKLFGLWLATFLLVRGLRRLFDFLNGRAKAYEGIKANDESIDEFFTSLKRVFARAAWLFFLAFAGMLLSFPEAFHQTLVVTIRIYIIIAVGWLTFRAIGAIVATLDALAEKYASTKDLLGYYDQLRGLVPLLRRVIEASIYIVVATLVAHQIEAMMGLAIWGVRLLKIVGFFFVSRVAIELARFVIEELLITRPTLSDEVKKRRQTFVPLAQSAFRYGAYFVFLIVSLAELGIDPGPILAGAGILGLAVGFGAQKLVADLVSGFFILFEGHYSVGDFIKVKGIEGQVVAIDLRTTHIVDTVRNYVIVRNSEIDMTETCSKSGTARGKLLPNVGAVREGERLLYRDIPWRVVEAGFFTELENPALRGGKIRVPLKDLAGLRSRLPAEDEPWFPSEIGHWVILQDGTYGQVVEQTPEVVTVSTTRGIHRSYPTADYLAQHPKNLSVNFFAVPRVVSLHYRYRDIVNTEIVTKLKASIEKGFQETWYGEHLDRVIVELKEMNASSLDVVTIGRFKGPAASEWTEIGWKIQQLALECCNENGWEIPFPQLTVHQAEGPETRGAMASAQ